MKIKMETGKDTRGNPKCACRSQVSYGVDLLLSTRGRERGTATQPYLEPREAYRRAPLACESGPLPCLREPLNASYPHLPRVFLLPGQRSRKHPLPSLQGSAPCSSCVMSFGLENAIPSHKKQTQSDLRLAAKEATTELQANVGDVKHPEGK